MPLVFTRPEPEKPKSRLRKIVTGQHAIQVAWGLLGTYDLFNAILDIISNKPAGAALELIAATLMWLYAWNPRRASNLAYEWTKRAVRGIVFAWKHASPVVALAVTVPYARLSDRYGLYGKFLRMRARIRRLKNKVRR